MGAVTRATPAHRWLLVATVLGSGMAYLDATVVNVALPALSADLDTDVRGLQWVLDAYLVSLTGLLLLGGALGDLYGRRAVFRIGAAGFAVSSVLCGLAPTTTTLVCARALQGVAGALLIPVSLALLSASIAEEERARTVGAWAGLTGVASAAGPFIGGWLVDTASWRWAFFINVPVAAVALAASAHVDESFDHDASRHLDLPGAATAIIGLVALTAGLILETPAITLARGCAARRVLADRAALAEPDAPPVAVPLRAVHRSERDDLRRLRRPRCRVLPGRSPASDRLGLLGARSRRRAAARHDSPRSCCHRRWVRSANASGPAPR